MTTEVDPDAPLAVAGETVIVRAGQPIPARCLAVDTIVAYEGTPHAHLLRITAIDGGPADPCVRSVDLVTGQTKIYRLAELEAIRPLGFVIPERPWRTLRPFVEGGLYQAWPNGRLFEVRHRHLVDAATGQRVFPQRDPRRLPALLPVFVERWVPRT